MLSALLAEIILTAIFLYVILGTTDNRAPKGFAGPEALGEVWLFIVAAESAAAARR